MLVFMIVGISCLVAIVGAILYSNFNRYVRSDADVYEAGSDLKRDETWDEHLKKIDKVVDAETVDQ